MRPSVLVPALALALVAGACADPAAAGYRAALQPVAAAPGTVQFGLVGEASALVETADYPHWDAGGSWAVPREAIWTLEQPLLSCRVATARRSIDAQGFPALDVALVPEDGERFRALSRRAVGRRLAVLVDGHVVLTPTVAEPLPPRFQLAGRFSEQDVTRLLEHLLPPPGG